MIDYFDCIFVVSFVPFRNLFFYSLHLYVNGASATIVRFAVVYEESVSSHFFIAHF